MNSVQNLPFVSVTFNSLTVLCLVSAFISIRKDKKNLHRAFMLGALSCSAIFLLSYLTFHYYNGVLHYNGTGLMRIVYLIILITHTILAVALLPMIVISVFWATKGFTEKHKKIAPITLAAWLYVSVTGIILFAVFMPIIS